MKIEPIIYKAHELTALKCVKLGIDMFMMGDEGVEVYTDEAREIFGGYFNEMYPVFGDKDVEPDLDELEDNSK